MSSGKMRKVVRAFFNTFYDDVANNVVEHLKKVPGVREVKVVRSRVVPEFYYIELEPQSEDLIDEVKEEIQRVIERLGEGKVFGVKVYAVR